MSANPSTVFIGEIHNIVTSDTPYLALYTSDPTAADTGTEVTGGSYARQPITFGSVTNGTISNTAIISFSNLQAGTITHYAVRNALTAGTMRVYGALATPVTLTAGSGMNIAVGQISINVTGS